MVGGETTRPESDVLTRLQWTRRQYELLLNRPETPGDQITRMAARVQELEWVLGKRGE